MKIGCLSLFALVLPLTLQPDKGSVKLTAEHQSRLPTPARADVAPAPGPALGLTTSIKQSIQISARQIPVGAGSAQAEYALRLTNISTNPIQVPRSNDGEEIYAKCSKDWVLVAYISLEHSKGDLKDSLEQSDLYGCEAASGSTVTLESGETVEFTGLNVPSVAEGDRFLYSLSRRKYLGTGDNHEMTMRGVFDIKSNRVSSK